MTTVLSPPPGPLPQGQGESRAKSPALARGVWEKDRGGSSFALFKRLWREHIRHHRGRLLLVLLLTGIMAGTTALYPVVIDHAFWLFTELDRRMLYPIPVLVINVTSATAG